MTGCGEIIDVTNQNNPKHEALARFAVDEYNKTQNAMVLQFVRLVNVKQQVVEGFMYYIILDATDGGPKNQRYETKVWDRASPNSKQLMEFKPILLGDGYSASA